MTKAEKILSGSTPVGRYAIMAFRVAATAFNPHTIVHGTTGKKLGNLYPTETGWNLSSAVKEGTWSAGMRSFASREAALEFIAAL
jgi:hypothetical protein